MCPIPGSGQNASHQCESLRLLRWHQELSFHGVQVRRFQASKNPAGVENLLIRSKELREAMVKDHLQGDYVVMSVSSQTVSRR